MPARWRAAPPVGPSRHAGEIGRDRRRLARAINGCGARKPELYAVQERSRERVGVAPEGRFPSTPFASVGGRLRRAATFLEIGFPPIAGAGAVVEHEPGAVRGEDEGNVERGGVIERLLHAVADDVRIVLGLDQRQRNVRLVIEDVVGALGLAPLLKLRQYREAADNLYAVVIEPRGFLVEIHAKSRNWQPTKLTQADDPIEMTEFGLTCRVGTLYCGTPLDPQSRLTRMPHPSR
jgi:hypothetical protein